MPTMPFGKFKGQPLCELPDDYLVWLLELDDLRQPLRRNLEAEAQLRLDSTPRQLPRELPSRRVVEELVEVGYRRLAATHHPDHDGSHEVMVAINRAVAWLREIASQLPEQP